MRDYGKSILLFRKSDIQLQCRDVTWSNWEIDKREKLET